MIVIVASVLAIIILLLYYVSTWKFDYWEKRKIPYLKPLPVLGNYGSYILQQKYMGQAVQSLCQKLPKVPYFGVFYGTKPALIVQDPEAIKLVLTKDFYYFNSREISKYTHKEVFTQNLFFTYGDRWKVLRQNITPLFSSSKMKKMFYLIEKCCHALEEMLDYEYKTSHELEVKSLMSRFTMDSIGSCGFGIETGTMDKDAENNPFTVIRNSVVDDSYYRGFKLPFRAIWPALFYRLGMNCFPTEAAKFFFKLMTEVFSGRQYKPTSRNDFVDLILNMMNDKVMVGDNLSNLKGGNKKVTLEIDDDLLVSQCILFFSAGFETSSSTLQYALYELAKDQRAQALAIAEVDKYLLKHNNKIGYECVTELPYIEACIEESMRVYPPGGVLLREVMEDYTLPCGAMLNPGTRVHIPVYHLHHNPDYFPDPEMFKPERFLGDAKRNITPYTYMPFGEGSRICIGMRFAKMQMFSGIITLLKKYRLELAKDMPRELKLIATTLVTQPAETIKLRFIEREGWEQRQLA